MDKLKQEKLISSFENFLSGQQALGDLTIRNYISDLNSLFDFMNMKKLNCIDMKILIVIHPSSKLEIIH